MRGEERGEERGREEEERGRREERRCVLTQLAASLSVGHDHSGQDHTAQ